MIIQCKSILQSDLSLAIVLNFLSSNDLIFDVFLHSLSYCLTLIFNHWAIFQSDLAIVFCDLQAASVCRSASPSQCCPHRCGPQDRSAMGLEGQLEVIFVVRPHLPVEACEISGVVFSFFKVTVQSFFKQRLPEKLLFLR